MPSSKAPKLGNEGTLLRSWRQEGATGTRAKIWLIVRRATATFLALALIGWLTYLMFSWTLVPKTYLGFVCADEVRTLIAPPIEFAYEDFAGYAKLEGALSSSVREGPPLFYSRLASPELLDAELDDLQSKSRIRNRDTVVLCITTHGVVLDGKAYLMCGNFDASAPEEQLTGGLYEVSRLLQRLAGLPGATKLLLLDVGRSGNSPRLGMPVNFFTEKVKEAVASELGTTTDSSSVWVLCAQSPGETSHVAPALRRSVFGYMASIGLQGAADLDNDGAVHLGELAGFVRYNVASWVKQATDSSESQTPLLMPRLRDAGPHLLFTASLPPVESVSADINAAQSNESQQSVAATVAKFISEQVKSFGMSPVNSMVSGLERMVAGDGEEGGEANAEREAERAARNQQAWDSSRIATEQGLVHRAWEMTAAMSQHEPHPAAYAPHLWRGHLDRLRWLEQHQQSGTRLDQRWMVDQLRALNRSLADFGEEDKPPPKDPRTLIDRIRHCRPTAPISAAAAPTLALAERIAAVDPGQSLAAPLQKFIAGYDAWLSSSTDGFERLVEIYDEFWEDDWPSYYELRIYPQLRDDPYLSLKTIKLALQVRRLGERVAADLLWGQGWAQDKTDRADGLRLEAERLLVDKAASDWHDRARLNLQQARTIYRDAQRDLSSVRNAQLLQRRTLSEARDYLHWSWHSARGGASRAPTERWHADLFAALRKLHKALDARQRSRVPNVAALRRIRNDIQDELQSSVSELTTAPYESGDVRRIDALLRTALLTPQQREECQAARLAAEQELMRGFEVAPPPSVVPTPESGRMLSEAAAKMESEWLFWEAFATFADKRSSQSAAHKELSERSAALGKSLSDLPGQIANQSKDRNMTSRRRRPEQLARLRQAACALFVMDALDSADSTALPFDGSDNGNVLQDLRAAAWYDLLVAASDRRRRAERDAPSEERAVLDEEAQRFLELARAIPRQPPAPTIAQSVLNLKVAQSEVRLLTEESATMTFDVTANEDTPVWLVAQFDDRLIDVEGDGWYLLRESEVLQARPSSASLGNAGYPYRPDARDGLSETLSLRAGQTETRRVRVRRRSSAGGDAVVVLKAVGRREHLRQGVAVRLPGRQDLRLSVFDGQRTRNQLDRPILLFPNRSQDLTLQLANHGGKAKSVVVNLYAAQQKSLVAIPRGAVAAATANKVLRSFGRPVPVAMGGQLQLQPDKLAIPLSFNFDSPENQSLWGATSAENPARIALKQGLLVHIIDQDTQQHTIRWLQFEVWRPRSFLTANAVYDPGVEEIVVTVSTDEDEASSIDRLPSGGMKARLDIERRYISNRGGGVFGATIREPSRRGVLRAPLNGRWPRDFSALANDYLPIYVHIDDYPRAFEFRVRKTTAPTTLPAIENITSLRIIAPRDGAQFPASEHIKTTVEVDAPERVFRGSANMVEIGVDVDQDRELKDEESLRLQSDRHVEFFALAPVAEGTLTLQSRVDDFKLELSTDGVQDQAVNILGQVVESGGQSTREYIEIVLDAQGPDLGVVKLIDDGEALLAELHPEDLTSVASVEGAMENSIEDGEAQWEEGKPSEGSQWLVRIDVAKLESGQHTVLLRATDAVGNVSDIRRETWVKVGQKSRDGTTGQVTAGNPTTPAQSPQPVTNRLTGRVTYGTRVVREIEVNLQGATAGPPKIRDDGRFVFESVRAGKYVLNARGLAGGNWRRAELNVTISDQPDTPEDVGEIEIR